jgi:hypothetical protein
MGQPTPVFPATPAGTASSASAGAAQGMVQTPVSPDVLGAELAASVIARALRMREPAALIANSMSLHRDRVQGELAYMAIFTMHFCIHTALGEHPACPQVISAFYNGLWSRNDWGATPKGAERRVRRYGDAFNNPHPEYGRGYWTGRVFARLCGASHELAVIEFGARTFVTQLPPILSFLRTVTLA